MAPAQGPISPILTSSCGTGPTDAGEEEEERYGVGIPPYGCFGGSPTTIILSPLPPKAPVGRLLAGFPRGHVRALPKAGEEAVGLQKGPAVPLRAGSGDLQELLVAPHAHRPVLGLVADLYGDAGLQHTRRWAQHQEPTKSQRQEELLPYAPQTSSRPELEAFWGWACRVLRPG